MVGNDVEGSAAAENLTNIDVVLESSINGQSVIKISSSAFCRVRIKSVTFSDTIEEICAAAFNFCYMETSKLSLPKSLKTIGSYAFSSNSIQKFIIGPNLESLGDGVFNDNLELEKFEVLEENQYFSSFDNALYDKKITILYCVPHLLRNYVIPHTVKELLHRSFSQQYATSVWIPHSVAILRDHSFFRIPNVRSIHIMGNIDKIEEAISSNRYNKLTIYYRGTKIYNETNVFVNRDDIKIMTCRECNLSYFGGKETTSFGSCFKINKTCKLNRPSYINRIMFMIALTFSS